MDVLRHKGLAVLLFMIMIYSGELVGVSLGWLSVFGCIQASSADFDRFLSRIMSKINFIVANLAVQKMQQNISNVVRQSVRA